MVESILRLLIVNDEGFCGCQMKDDEKSKDMDFDPQPGKSCAIQG
jgi:hypothetical protein